MYLGLEPNDNLEKEIMELKVWFCRIVKPGIIRACVGELKEEWLGRSIIMISFLSIT